MATEQGGGLEFPHLWDGTNLHKLTMLQSGLLKEGTDLQRALIGAVCRMKDWARLSEASMQSSKMLLTETDGTAWLGSLWKWMVRGGYKIKLPVVGKSPMSECILDRYVDYELGKLTAQEQRTWDIYCANTSYDTAFPSALRGMKHRISEVRNNLWKWKITWVHELGDDEATSARELAQGKLCIRKSLDWRYNQTTRNEWVECLVPTGVVQDTHSGRGGAVTVHCNLQIQWDGGGCTAKERLLHSELSNLICAENSTLTDLDNGHLPPPGGAHDIHRWFFDIRQWQSHGRLWVDNSGGQDANGGRYTVLGRGQGGHGGH